MYFTFLKCYYRAPKSEEASYVLKIDKNINTENKYQLGVFKSGNKKPKLWFKYLLTCMFQGLSAIISALLMLFNVLLRHRAAAVLHVLLIMTQHINQFTLCS